MPLPTYRLRRWLAVTAVLFTLAVAGMYFYARMRAISVLKEFPGKIGYDIKQTATGFQFSKSDGGRTIFTIQATDLKEFKLNGRAELHNVSIVLYGRDSSRFDQIYGDDFAYDPKSGDVTAKGEVQIDIEANPSGLTSPDQTTPKELKNPIHLTTRDLVFNRESGNASTAAKVEFRTPQATGWAVGMQYAAHTNTLTLVSQIHVAVSGANAAVLEATHGRVTGDPRQIVLDHPHLDRAGGTLQADQATFALGPDNHVERVLATGNVSAEAKVESQVGSKKATGKRTNHSSAPPEAEQLRARADAAELLLTGKESLLTTATLQGNVHVERIGLQSMQGEAGRVTLDVAGQNELQKIHASERVRLTQHSTSAATEQPPANASVPQDFAITAPVIDFLIAKGRLLDRAVTSGSPEISIFPANASPADKTSAQRTVITAGKFEAKFERTRFERTREGRSRLATVRGTPDAKIVSINPGQPDRVSTSHTVEASFLPQGGIEAVTQQGNVAYTDGQTPDKRTQAWADQARYTPADQMLLLTGSPRVAEGSMATTAQTITINRANGDAIADGEVKSTYSELKEHPNGALLASASPIHVTANAMTARNTPGIALYSGNARLWQDANLISAPSIEFDRSRRFLTAQGTEAQPVSTVMVQSGKSLNGPENAQKTKGKATPPSPISITARQLTYADADRKLHYEGGVLAKGTGFTASAKTADAFLLSRSQTSSNQSLAVNSGGPGQLDHMVAQGDVVVHQASRRAEGQTLTYIAAEDKFVLTGGPPSIFDAERGKITGVSLTFFRRDDRVLVEGEASTPVVTQTRVAR
jgi:lipopolysaccharide export system protein LptA